MIPAIFITHASEVLGDTNHGLSWSQIVKYCSSYAVEFNVDIPYSQYSFPTGLPNKRTGLQKNLMGVALLGRP